MLNEQIVEVIINKYGEKKAAMFCEMQGYYNKILAAEFSLNKRSNYEVNEFIYDKDWFMEKAFELHKKIEKDEQKIPNTTTTDY
jgi:hypothetical protein